MILVGQVQAFKGEVIMFSGGVKGQVVNHSYNVEGVVKHSFSTIVDGEGSVDFVVGMAAQCSCEPTIDGNRFWLRWLPPFDVEINNGVRERGRYDAISHLHGYDVINWIFPVE